jgi:hypothetical protein
LYSKLCGRKIPRHVVDEFSIYKQHDVIWRFPV